jgi:hypothetical protein
MYFKIGIVENAVTFSVRRLDIFSFAPICFICTDGWQIFGIKRQNGPSFKRKLAVKVNATLGLGVKLPVTATST